MPDALTCTSCRSPIDVPADFDGDTIRCGICWTEVAVPRPVVPVVKPAAAVPAAKPKPAPAAGSAAVKGSGVKVAALLPSGAKPAAGMARLEALLHKAGSRLHPPAAPVKAAPVRGGPPPVAPLLPASGVVPAAPVEVIEPEIVAEVPVIPPATAAPPAPVLRPAPVGKTRPDDDEPVRKKTRYKSRDDEDDDRPRKRSTGGGAVVFAVTAAAVLVLVLGVCGFFLYQELTDGSSDETAGNPAGQPGNNAAPPPNPNPLPPFRVQEPAPLPNNPPAVPDDQPGFVPPFDPRRINPPRVNPPRAAVPELDWQPVQRADGFEAKLPGRQIIFDTWQENIFDTANFLTIAKGKKYLAHAQGYNFEITYVDAPPAARPDLKKMAAGPFGKPDQVTATKVGGRDGYEYLHRRSPTHQEVRRAVQVGRRVFVFAANLHAIGGRDENHLEEAKKTFYDAVKITLDGGAGAAADPGPGANPDDPPGGPPAGRGNEPAAAAGPAIPAAARVPPFWAAAVLPQRGEVLFLGTRMNAGRLAGELRRYTYPGFLPKNTYYLPYPVTFAVADEKDGKLAVTTVTRTDPLLREAERNIGHGDVQVYDLKPILDGSVADRDELKPAATIPFASRLAGLELAGGKAVVLSLTAQPQNKAKPWKPRLTPIDLVAGRALPELELPDPCCRIKASADGSKVYAAEAPLSPAGAPMFGLPRNGYVLVVDAKGWKREKTYTVPGTAVDVSAAADGTVLASVALNREFKLYAIPEAGNIVDLNPAGGRPATLGYAALTADGKKLVTAASVATGATGVEVYDVSGLGDPSGLRRVASARAVKLPNAAADAEAPIGGHFHLTPDGKFALFQVGVVLDLTKLPAN